MKLVNWNVQWATPRSPRRVEILRRIQRHDPEVVCLTETHTGLLSQEGHTICSQPDYGYPIKDGRRKVMLWSREPWEQVDDVGIDSMPPGRFVSGVTQTSVGEITVIGICIPWFGSRTEARRTSERKKRWEDHEQYLAGLTEVLKRASAKRLIVVGDFNQAIGPGSRAPLKLRSALREAFPPGMTIVTSALAFQGRKCIDHIALSDDLAFGFPGSGQQHPRGKETVRPFRSRRRLVCPALPVALRCPPVGRHLQQQFPPLRREPQHRRTNGPAHTRPDRRKYGLCRPTATVTHRVADHTPSLNPAQLRTPQCREEPT